MGGRVYVSKALLFFQGNISVLVTRDLLWGLLRCCFLGFSLLLLWMLLMKVERELDLLEMCGLELGYAVEDTYTMCVNI